MKVSFELARVLVSGSIHMQIGTKGNGSLVRVNGGSGYPGFDLAGLYCSYHALYTRPCTPLDT